MSNLTHYHKCIRKITSAFSTLFNNIILIKENQDGSENQRLIVPIEYGDKEKFVKRLQGDPVLDKKIQISLPRMSYEMTGFSYDSSRKLNTNNKNFAFNPENNDAVFMQYNPVPYDLNYSLTIYTRNVEDGNQIVEQIIPYFTPDYSLRVNLVPEMNIVKVLPITLNKVDQIIDSDGLYNTEVRTVIWTLNFTVKAFIFGAVKDAKIIKEVIQSVSSPFGDLNNYGGSSCCHPASKSFIMDSNGFGQYFQNEIVYQGQNLELAYSSGKVQEWNSNANTLLLSETCGTFKLNQPIIGTDSLTIRKAVSYASNNIIAFTANTTVTPNTANANSNSFWETITTITEYDA
jgi:T4-like virus Myoviridae tail sheath stabiliser